MENIGTPYDPFTQTGWLKILDKSNVSVNANSSVILTFESSFEFGKYDTLFGFSDFLFNARHHISELVMILNMFNVIYTIPLNFLNWRTENNISYFINTNISSMYYVSHPDGNITCGVRISNSNISEIIIPRIVIYLVKRRK